MYANPNEDVLNSIYKIESRSEKMITLSIALMSLNFITNSKELALNSILFFILSFVFYLLTFLKSPDLVIKGTSRDKLMTLAEKDPVKKDAINKIDKDIRRTLIDVRGKKLLYIQAGHSSFFSFVLIFFSSFVIRSYFPNFFQNLVQLFLFSLVFLLLSVIVFIFFFLKPSKRIALEKE